MCTAAAMEQRVGYSNFISIKMKKQTEFPLFFCGQFLLTGSCPGPRSSFFDGVFPRTPEQFFFDEVLPRTPEQFLMKGSCSGPQSPIKIIISANIDNTFYAYLFLCPLQCVPVASHMMKTHRHFAVGVILLERLPIKTVASIKRCTPQN